MLLVPPAILFHLDACCVVLFVFLGRIIPPLALGTFERDDHSIFFLCHYPYTLCLDCRDDARTYRVTTFSNGEAFAFVQRHRRDQLYLDRHAVARHHHFHTRR